MSRVVVVGTGAGGAAVARALAGRFQVTLLEKGKDTPAFRRGLGTLARLRSSGMFFDPRMISWIVRRMQIRKVGSTILVNGLGPGGTTPLATGNAIRADKGLRALGIRLEDEFADLERELPITTAHERGWQRSTRALFDAFQDLGLQPTATPKMVDPSKCTRCGKCVLGCERGARWDARVFLRQAQTAGATLITGCTVEAVESRGSRATGVRFRRRGRCHTIPADLVVLAAGGLGTPIILEASGIKTEPTLFVDPVLCVAGVSPQASQDREVPMPFVAQRGAALLSPYFDWLSFFFDRRWRHDSGNIVSLMIKLADLPGGRVSADGRVEKILGPQDEDGLQEATRLCRSILAKIGVREDRMFLGTLNAGHPGGTLALTEGTARGLHDGRLPESCWVADASLLPGPFGLPPILTVMALATRVAKSL